MDELFKEALGECLYDNTLNEGSMAGDIASWEPLLLPLVKKIYPNSLVEQIASVQPTKSPLAKVSYLNAIYSGNASNVENNVHWTNSRLITISASANASFVVGSTYTLNTTPSMIVQVFYKEVTYEYTTNEVSSGITVTQSVSSLPKNCNMLIAAVSGSLDTSNGMFGLIAGNTIGSEVIRYTTTNKNTIKKVFRDYSTVLENNSNLREISFEVATKTIPTVSRKIRSKFSQEKLEDYKNLYNLKAYDLVAESIGNEVRQDIDREIIDYLKHIATPMQSDINIPLSLGAGAGGGLEAISYDLYGSIYLAVEEIVKATKRNRTVFILADSATCALLVLNAHHSKATPDESNPYHVGSIGPYELYCDPFATEHYIMVGYNFKSKDKNDAGLYFTPYSTTIHEVTSGDGTSVMPFSQNFMVMNRYGYTSHPQDSGTGNGDSDFFRIFSVNYSMAGMTIPNFPEQFRTEF
jgi:hypothetical protein